MLSLHPLHDAVEADDLPRIERILKLKQIGPNYTYPPRIDADGVVEMEGIPPPLFLCKSAEAARLLLAARADMEYNYTIDDDKAYGTPLHTAAAFGRYCVVELLISKGANVNSLDNCNRTPLHLTNSLACVKLLTQARANVNAKDTRQYTPLIRAAMYPVEITAVLIRAGALLDFTDFVGETALYIACDHSNYATARLLLESGADPNNFIYEDDGPAPLHAAVAPGRMHMDYDDYLVKASRRSVDARHQQLELVDALVLKGAEVNRVDREGYTPIMLTEDPRLIQLLLLLGADINRGDERRKSQKWKSIVNVVKQTSILDFVNDREVGLIRNKRRSENGHPLNGWSRNMRRQRR